MTESELGMQLFERIGRKVYLTDVGRAFLPFAQQAITETETGIQKLRDIFSSLTEVIDLFQDPLCLIIH